MYTKKFDDGSKIFYSDATGEIEIVDTKGKRIHMNGQNILEFVADHIREKRISKLEMMTTEEILLQEGKEK